MSVEYGKFTLKRHERGIELKKCSETLEVVKEEIKKRNELLSMIDSSLDEQPKLIEQIEEKLKVFVNKKNNVESNISKCDGIFEDLNFIFTQFNEILSPFSKKKDEALKVIEAFTAWIVLWNKYPFRLKKNLILATSMVLKLEAEKFDTYIMHDLLYGEKVMIEVLQSGIPCNLNFTNNIAIIDFLRENEFLQVLVLDPLG